MPDSVRGQIRHLYVHVPFCGRRCSYCDFSIAVRRRVPAAEFSTLIAAELGGRLERGQVGQLDTVYFGGGTPSKLGPAGVRGLIGRLKEAGTGLNPGAEVTLEANPEDVSGDAAEQWLESGITRLSIGVQSFAPDALTWMHRTHDAGQARLAVRAARAAGVRDISIDLIYALPARLDRAWSDDLTKAIALAPDHLSVYGLTVEPRTPLGKWTARGAEVPQTDDRAADEFLAADARLRSAGFEHYEVSSYARPGFRSRHNTAYWRRVPYLGLGPSAHSFDGAVRRWNVAALAAWQSAVGAGADPEAGHESLTPEQQAAELIYLGLRTDSGTMLSGKNLDRARRWVAAGWATEGASPEPTPAPPRATPPELPRAEPSAPSSVRIRLTAEGWLRLDALAASLSAS